MICDLDGTLCNIEHRKAHFLAGELRAFESKIEDDTLSLNVAAAVALMSSALRLKVFLVTGREERHRGVTETWLAKHVTRLAGLPLLMRKDGDERPDDVVKEELYRTHIEPAHNVVLVLEDRDHVVAMWRNLGLECWQVANGSY